MPSDSDFIKLLNDPSAFGIKYLLAVPPTGRGVSDALNLRYPTLYETGAEVATLELEIPNDGDSQPDWRLYRVNEPVGDRACEAPLRLYDFRFAGHVIGVLCGLTASRYTASCRAESPWPPNSGQDRTGYPGLRTGLGAVRRAEGARRCPNVLYLVWDDTGIATWDCFGGLVDMPNMSRIAERGVRLSQFHTTALCSPTRASLLTGRNATTVGMATIEEFTDGFPNCSGRIPYETALISEVLAEKGWNTYCVGKWHLTPLEESNLAATKRHWPLNRGFERFYGFMGGETDQWYPDLVYDNHPVAPPGTPEQGYHLSKDLADKTIEFIRDAKVIAPTSRGSPTCAPAPVMRHTTSSRSGPTSTRAGSTWATSATARSSWRTRRSSASSRPTPNCRR